MYADLKVSAELLRCAVAAHCEDNDHRIDFENACVETNFHQRLYIESWHIQTTPGNVNQSSGI